MEIVGSTAGGILIVFRNTVEISTKYAQDSYPTKLEPKQIQFDLDAATCASIFARFAQRLQAISDEVATIEFTKADYPGGKHFGLMLYSERMKTQVLSKPYEAEVLA